MFSYPETQWRTRIIKIMLWILLGAILLLVLAWFWLTQPLIFHAQPSSTRTVDPARLEAHVRKLSIEFSPRDVSHLETSTAPRRTSPNNSSKPALPFPNNRIASRIVRIAT